MELVLRHHLGESYQVRDAWDEMMFTAQPGDEYLMAGYNGDFGLDHATLLYLTAYGPVDFDIDAPGCRRSMGVEYKRMSGKRAVPVECFFSCCGSSGPRGEVRRRRPRTRSTRSSARRDGA